MGGGGKKESDLKAGAQGEAAALKLLVLSSCTTLKTLHTQNLAHSKLLLLVNEKSEAQKSEVLPHGGT